MSPGAAVYAATPSLLGFLNSSGLGYESILSTPNHAPRILRKLLYQASLPVASRYAWILSTYCEFRFTILLMPNDIIDIHVTQV